MTDLIESMMCTDPEQRPDILTILSRPFVSKAVARLEERLTAATASEANDTSSVSGVEMILQPISSPASAAAATSATNRMDASFDPFASQFSTNWGLTQPAVVNANLPNLPQWGAHGTGLYSWGHTTLEPTVDQKFLDNTRLQDVPLRQMAVGRYHKLALMASGEVMSWSWDGSAEDLSNGQLGHGSGASYVTLPRTIAELDGLQ
eukprot:gene7386-8797_t